jgi:hypothetical protein
MIIFQLLLLAFVVQPSEAALVAWYPLNDTEGSAIVRVSRCTSTIYISSETRHSQAFWYTCDLYDVSAVSRTMGPEGTMLPLSTPRHSTAII